MTVVQQDDDDEEMAEEEAPPPPVVAKKKKPPPASAASETQQVVLGGAGASDGADDFQTVTIVPSGKCSTVPSPISNCINVAIVEDSETCTISSEFVFQSDSIYNFEVF